MNYANYTSQRYRVLTVSPDSPTRDGLRAILSGEQFHVLSAESGQQALRTMRDHLVDVVILDHRTPFMRKDPPGENGRTLEAIVDASPFLPVVLVCAKSAELDHQTTLMADLIVTHPVKASVLYSAMDTVLGESLRERAQRKAGGLSVVRLSI